MKRWILWMVCLIAVMCSSCSTTLMGNRDEVPYEVFGNLDVMKTPSLKQPYFTSYWLRQVGAYEEAYTIFQRLSDQLPEAATEASRFKWQTDTLVRTDTYIDGQWVASEKAVYDVYGKLMTPDEDRQREGFTRSADNTYVLTETWLYNHLEPQTYTEAPYYLEFTYDPNGVVIAVTRTPWITWLTQGVAITGYTVNYIYDADGKLIRETGADRLHYIPSHDGVIAISELPFEATYTYDDCGRLQRYDRSYPDVEGGVSWDQYTYDTNGNLLVHESRKEGDVFFDSEILWESIVRENRYDKDGNKIFESTLVLRGQNPENAQRDYAQTVYQYEDGHLMKKTQTSEGSESVSVIEHRYTYDDLLVYITEQKEVTGDDTAAAETGKPK